MTIPDLIHIVWVGDNSKAPEKAIASWREQNPGRRVMVWRNEDLNSRRWRAQHWIAHFGKMGELCGVADVMRWEILEEMGGFAVDADAPCLRPLDDWLFEVTAFACWENERARPGLLNNGFVACAPGDRVVAQINRDLETEQPPWGQRAWQTTGPVRLTATWQLLGQDWTVWPSHFFMPRHFSGPRFTGNGPVYAEQKWGSTVGYEGIE